MSRKNAGCSDVVIRALRSQKVDLQKLVHEDMAKNFAEYPQKWQLSARTATASITVGVKSGNWLYPPR